MSAKCLQCEVSAQNELATKGGNSDTTPRNQIGCSFWSDPIFLSRAVSDFIISALEYNFNSLEYEHIRGNGLESTIYVKALGWPVCINIPCTLPISAWPWVVGAVQLSLAGSSPAPLLFVSAAAQVGVLVSA